MYHPPVVLIFIFVYSCCCLCLSLPIYPVINLSINPVDQSVDQSVSNTLSINPVDQSVSNNRAQPKTNPLIVRRPDNAEPAQEPLLPPDDLSLDRDSPRRLGAPIAFFLFFCFCFLCFSFCLFFRVAACAFRCRSTLSSICRSIPSINLSINLCLTPCQSILSINLCLTTSWLSIYPVDQSSFPINLPSCRVKRWERLARKRSRWFSRGNQRRAQSNCRSTLSAAVRLGPEIQRRAQSNCRSTLLSSKQLSINPVDQSVSNNQLAVELKATVDQPCRSICV